MRTNEKQIKSLRKLDLQMPPLIIILHTNDFEGNKDKDIVESNPMKSVCVVHVSKCPQCKYWISLFL